jgi:hypothetical protein
MNEKKSNTWWPLGIKVKVKNIKLLIMTTQEYTQTMFCDKKI